MTFNDVTRLLTHNAANQGIQYGLGRIKKALDELENPQDHLVNPIHIAGTNGKGSTTAYITSALIEAGYSVATYTSPHIQCYTERFKINNCAISQEKFVHYFEIVEALKSKNQLTEFEKLTIMAFLYFKDETPQFCIFETGLGGLLDATNVITPIVTAISKIGIDHEDLLGNTVEEIALQKAGIIKSRIPIIISRQAISVLHVIRKTAQNLEAPLVVSDSDLTLPEEALMQGEFQKENRALARKVLMLLPITYSKKKDILERGLNKAKMWGRFNIYANALQTIIVDGAHNIDGVEALLIALEKEFPHTPFSFLVGLNKNKEYKRMAQLIADKCTRFYYCQFDSQIAASSEDLKLTIPQDKWTPYAIQELDKLPIDSHLVICGSLYFLEHIQKIITKNKSLKEGSPLKATTT